MMHDNLTRRQHALIAAQTAKTAAVSALTGNETRARINWKTAQLHLGYLL